jgi:hypothetical protein
LTFVVFFHEQDKTGMKARSTAFINDPDVANEWIFFGVDKTSIWFAGISRIGSVY